MIVKKQNNRFGSHDIVVLNCYIVRGVMMRFNCN